MPNCNMGKTTLCCIILTNELGCDAIHTLDLPDCNAAGDSTIIEIAAEQQRVVVSKNSDFIDSHYLRGKPENCC